jgi:hypothetical protein
LFLLENWRSNTKFWKRGEKISFRS